jgi:hypothetical protein
MATTIKQTESEPESYPTTSPAVTLNDIVWQRIEPYIRHRYTPRAVEWIVEGPGEWSPPLQPATISTVEVWSRAGEWEACTPDAGSLGGYWLSASGPFRFTGTVGGGSPAPIVPAIIWEAVKRLSAFFSAKQGTPGVRSESISAGSISINRTRDTMAMADAMRQSGAADLLRGFR